MPCGVYHATRSRPVVARVSLTSRSVLRSAKTSPSFGEAAFSQSIRRTSVGLSHSTTHSTERVQAFASKPPTTWLALLLSHAHWRCATHQSTRYACSCRLLQTCAKLTRARAPPSLPSLLYASPRSLSRSPSHTSLLPSPHPNSISGSPDACL